MIIVPSNTSAMKPPNSQVTLVNSLTGSGSTSVSIPSHVAGDLLVIAAFRRNCTAGNDAHPTVPSGWSAFSSLSQIAAYGYTTSYVIASQVAASSGYVSGSWANATDMISFVFRGQGPTGRAPFAGAGGYLNLGGPTSSTSVTSYSATLNDNTGKSVVVYAVCHSSSVSTTPTTPTGWTRLGASTWLKPFRLTSTAVSSFNTPAFTFSAATSYTGFALEVVGY